MIRRAATAVLVVTALVVVPVAGAATAGAADGKRPAATRMGHNWG